jgi:NADPH:quinone reductase-like Zn-dependent oxidoreductase
MMKAIVVREYGGPTVLKYEDFPDPIAGSGEVLVRVAATSVNPIDLKRRSGAMKSVSPINFPGVIGVDVSGTIAAIGPGVQDFAVGDKVFAMASHSYAELCVVKAAILARIPDGIDLVEAAAIPLVTTTGNQLISIGADLKSGQTVLISGAAGNVGRSAVFAAKSRGARVLAAVLRRQLPEAAHVGADQVVATDEPEALAQLPQLDAVADTVGGKTAEILIGKVKRGGVFASTLGVPQNAEKYPAVKAVPVYARADANILRLMAEAVKTGRLVIPIGAKMPLENAAEAHAAAEKAGFGKVLLTT